MKILQFNRSPIVKGIKKIKEVRDGIWRNRIDSASHYDDTPLCAKCGNKVVKLKYKFKLCTDLFHATCRVCGNTWYTIRHLKEKKLSQKLINEAAGKGLTPEDWEEIKQLRDKKLEEIKRNNIYEQTRILLGLR